VARGALVIDHGWPGSGPTTSACGGAIGAGERQEERLDEVRTILDVGANIGKVTAEYLAHFPDAELHSFEPMPEAYASLMERHGRNPRVHAIRAAVSERKGQASFYVTPIGVTSSLLPHIENRGERIDVETTTLDDYCREHRLDHVDILKIDVEGGELLTPRGAHESLSARRFDLIFAEARLVAATEDSALLHHVAAHLEPYGYSLHNLYDMVESRTRGFIYGNAIFLSPQLRERLIARFGKRAFVKRY
jgi:FkbM family methyltransferase